MPFHLIIKGMLLLEKIRLTGQPVCDTLAAGWRPQKQYVMC